MHTNLLYQQRTAFEDKALRVERLRETLHEVAQQYHATGDIAQLVRLEHLTFQTVFALQALQTQAVALLHACRLEQRTLDSHVELAEALSEVDRTIAGLYHERHFNHLLDD